MREPTHKTAKLPRQLLEELGVSTDGYVGSRKKRNGPTNRKELRKAARVQKKSSSVTSTRGPPLNKKLSNGNARPQTKSFTDILQTKAPTSSVQPESIVEFAQPQPKKTRERVQSRPIPSSPSLLPSPKISKGVRDKLAEDDAQIAALERALGVEGTKKLPKSFEEDGLDSLLEGIDDAVGLDGGQLGKRKRKEGEEWLERKRQKAQRDAAEDDISECSEAGLEEDYDNGSEVQGSLEDNEESGSTETDGFDGFSTSDEERSQSLPTGIPNKTRENPYLAPGARSAATEAGKYVPPRLRDKGLTNVDDLSQLRRQIQGLLNRLSEANMISIIEDVEKLYQNRPRQHVTTTLLDLLMELLSDPTSLQDTFIILHAGFIAALYKIIGTDFGAQAIQRVDEDFKQNYRENTVEEGVGKKLANLVSLLSELYNFHVVGSNLIYDYVRLCLHNISEMNTELLLKIVRNAGQQLRHDDPSSLKDIIIQMQTAIGKTGNQNLSVRTKFMIETINNLKNNRMRTGVAASTISSEHTIRMKKTLGSLNTRALKASEPLRIGMKDLRDRDKVGTWWLVGASYKGNDLENKAISPGEHINHHGNTAEQHLGSIATDLLQLAKEQRMNTDVRRSIFVSIMSSTDYNDAYIRLTKLRLKRAQELEIPKVLIHCAGAEKVYNPFYTFLSRRVCSDKKLKMSFQFSLWDLFKQMGEGDDEPDSEDQEEDEGRGALPLRSLVNLAKMFGVLIAEGGLSLDVLKNLNLVYLQPKTQMFVEILLVTVILHSQQGFDGHERKQALLDIFLKAKQASDMATGLRYFLKKFVRKTDVAGNKSDIETVKWGCKIVSDALNAVANQAVAVE